MSKSKHTKEQTAAVITINRPAEMSQNGANKVAAWMERQARFLRKHRDQLDKRFRARYIYTSALILTVLMTGCVNLNDPASLANALVQARGIGRDGASMAMAVNPEYRKQLVETRKALAIVEALPQDKATFDNLAQAFQPIIAIQDPKIQLYVLAGRSIVRIISAASGKTVEVDVSKYKSVPQFAKAFGDGIDEALTVQPSPP